MRVVRVEKVKAAAEKYRGSDIERGLLYTDYSGNHCLVGQIFEDLGLPLPEPESKANASSVTGIYFGNFCSRNEIFIEKEAKSLLYGWQTLADAGLSWGLILEGMKK